MGLGGATFPTHVKLSPPKGKRIDTLILNGCECEPYLTADYRLMLEAPGPIITGALLAAHAVGAGDVPPGYLLRRLLLGLPFVLLPERSRWPCWTEPSG